MAFPSLFSRLETKVSKALDRTQGERTLIEPMVESRYAVAADPSRQAVTVIGVVDFYPVIAGARSSTRYVGDAAHVSGEKIHVSYAESAFSDQDHWPRKGDTITALDRDNQPVFTVAVVEPDGLGRLVCRCSVVSK